jgi:hypothetical protein
VSERTVNGPQFYLSCPPTVSTSWPHGPGMPTAGRLRQQQDLPTQGLSRRPLLQATAGPQEIRGLTFSLNTTASPEQPVQWQLSRQPDFSQISQTLLLTTPQHKLTCRRTANGIGAWHIWMRKASPAPIAKPSPYWPRACSPTPAVPALLARHYPVKDARYTLTCLPRPTETVIYRNTAPAGMAAVPAAQRQFLARLEIHGEAGYHAIEANEIIQLH